MSCTRQWTVYGIHKLIGSVIVKLINHTYVVGSTAHYSKHMNHFISFRHKCVVCVWLYSTAPSSFTNCFFLCKYSTCTSLVLLGSHVLSNICIHYIMQCSVDPVRMCLCSFLLLLFWSHELPYMYINSYICVYISANSN